MRLSDALYRAARSARDAEAVTSGDPEKIKRRVRNRIVARFMSRLTRRVFR